MAEKRKDAHGAAIASAGAVTAGTGLAAGGIPGAKSKDVSIIKPENIKPGKGKTRAGRGVSFARQNAVGAAKAGSGGILGFRSRVHEGGLYDFTEKSKHKAAQTPSPDRAASHAFSHGYVHGKIAPEEKIIRQMRGGKKAAGLALVGGVAATGYGLKRAKEEIGKSEKHSDRFSGTLAGTGAAGLAVGAGGHKVLRGQERKWRNTSNASIDEAHKLVPGLGGRKSNQNIKQYRKHLRGGGTPENFPKTMEPERHVGEIARDKKVFEGVKPDVARKAGALRGTAAQAEHFSHVYGNTAKVVGKLRMPSAIIAGAGAGGLVATRLRDKKPVAKAYHQRMSAFGVEH